MKNLLATFLFSFAESFLFSQPIYATLTMIEHPFNGKLHGLLHDGSTSLTSPDMVLKDESGKKIEFNSDIDALNLLAKNGWRYVDTYLDEQGGKALRRWLLVREE